MELRILDSILHGVLKPWKLNTSNNKRFTELVKAAKRVKPATSRELHAQLYALLADFPTLQEVLEAEIPLDKKLQPLCFNINLPMYKNAVTNFYCLVITLETLRIYNRVFEYPKIYTNKIDFSFQIGKVMNYAKVLAEQASIEMDIMGFSGTPAQVEASDYTVYFLKHSLIQLYFSIQEQFKDYLEETTTIEDFFILDLKEDLTAIVPLEKMELSEQKEKSNTKKISFGFNEDVGKLRIVINQLCVKIELLNGDTSTDDMINILTTKNLLPGSVKIQIGCETVQFRYIIDKLKPYFSSLTPQNIEFAACFYSKKGTLIKAQNLYTNKITHPKEKDKIDNIIKQLQ